MFRLCLFAIVATACFYGTQGAAIEKLITGKVTCAGSKIIDPKWKIHIELRSTSVKDPVGLLVALTNITDVKTFPISYTLKYHQSDIKKDHSYSIFVKINGSDHQLLFTNEVSTPVVLTGTTPPVIDIAVVRIGSNGKPCSRFHCPNDKPKHCAYGYEKKDGCEICKCHDPCHPATKTHVCKSKERCIVDKKEDGTFLARCDKAPIKRDQIPLTKEVCKEPKKTGTCRMAHPRFYYNSVTKACENFTYGGCGGNANNFNTKLDCEKLCQA
jgi:uncharacterized lipoprotein YbaY